MLGSVKAGVRSLGILTALLLIAPALVPQVAASEGLRAADVKSGKLKRTLGKSKRKQARVQVSGATKQQLRMVGRFVAAFIGPGPIDESPAELQQWQAPALDLVPAIVEGARALLITWGVLDGAKRLTDLVRDRDLPRQSPSCGTPTSTVTFDPPPPLGPRPAPEAPAVVSATVLAEGGSDSYFDAGDWLPKTVEHQIVSVRLYLAREAVPLSAGSKTNAYSWPQASHWWNPSLEERDLYFDEGIYPQIPDSHFYWWDELPIPTLVNNSYVSRFEGINLRDPGYWQYIVVVRNDCGSTNDWMKEFMHAKKFDQIVKIHRVSQDEEIASQTVRRTYPSYYRVDEQSCDARYSGLFGVLGLLWDNGKSSVSDWLDYLTSPSGKDLPIDEDGNPRYGQKPPQPEPQSTATQPEQDDCDPPAQEPNDCYEELDNNQYDYPDNEPYAGATITPHTDYGAPLTEGQKLKIDLSNPQEPELSSTPDHGFDDQGKPTPKQNDKNPIVNAEITVYALDRYGQRTDSYKTYYYDQIGEDKELVIDTEDPNSPFSDTGYYEVELYLADACNDQYPKDPPDGLIGQKEWQELHDTLETLDEPIYYEKAPPKQNNPPDIRNFNITPNSGTGWAESTNPLDADPLEATFTVPKDDVYDPDKDDYVKTVFFDIYKKDPNTGIYDKVDSQIPATKQQDQSWKAQDEFLNPGYYKVTATACDQHANLDSPGDEVNLSACGQYSESYKVCYESNTPCGDVGVSGAGAGQASQSKAQRVKRKSGETMRKKDGLFDLSFR